MIKKGNKYSYDCSQTQTTHSEFVDHYLSIGDFHREYLPNLLTLQVQNKVTKFVIKDVFQVIERQNLKSEDKQRKCENTQEYERVAIRRNRLR